MPTETTTLEAPKTKTKIIGKAIGMNVFAEEYTRDFDAVRAYQKAFPTNAKRASLFALASKMLHSSKMQSLLQEKQARLQEKLEAETGITKARIVSLHCAIAEQNLERFVDREESKRYGVVMYRAPWTLTEAECIGVRRFKEIDRQVMRGRRKGKTVKTYEPVLQNPDASLEVLAKHLGVYIPAPTGESQTNDVIAGLMKMNMQQFDMIQHALDRHTPQPGEN